MSTEILLWIAGGAVAVLGTGALAACYTVVRITKLQQERVERLERSLEVFAQASMQVAKTVDQLVINGGEQSLGQTASRRWLLAEADRRLQGGTDLREIVRPLGLSQDEVRLLDRRQRAH